MRDTIRNARDTKYLGLTITNPNVTDHGSIERVKKARRRLHLLKKCKVNASMVNRHTLLNICDSFILSTATYGLQMIPTDANLGQLWDALEK